MWLLKVTKYGEYSEFGKAIKKALIEKPMMATELADMLGIKPQYLNSIIHGKKSGQKYKNKIIKLLDLAA